jgi:hypothetical protein
MPQDPQEQAERIKSRALRDITMPPKSPGGEKETIRAHDLIIVGANGSGKSRLGVWIETNHPDPKVVHRVAAQKILEIPDHVSDGDTDAARRALYFGYDQPDAGPHHRVGSRDQNRPQTGTRNDYANVLRVLFSDHNDHATRFLQAHSDGERPRPPDTLVARLIRIWQLVLPRRTLKPSAGKMDVASAGSATNYHARDMSDGERVVLYLVGQVLCAPPGALIVVDEPELHLHRAIQARLWDAAENERPDCTFVYMTHDVDFAASRARATKVFVSDFDGANWTWGIVPTDTELPEAMLLEVLGNRKRTLFVEGDRGGLDDQIYRLVYPDFDVRPVGGWQRVLAATKAFNQPALKALHRTDAVGIVDRDYRTDSDIAGLQKQSVHCLHVAHVEHLLLTEAFLNVLRKRLTAPSDAVARAKAKIIEEFSKHAPVFALAKSEYVIDRKFGAIARAAQSIGEVQARIDSLVATVKAVDVHQQALGEAADIVARGDYAGALRVFKRRGLAGQIDGFFGPGSAAEYAQKAIQVVRQDREALAALRQGLPVL